MKPVTIKIRDNNKIIEIEWEADMNIQEALQKAYNKTKKEGGKFDFALQYYGYSGNDYLGYLVVMIDGIYDNPKDPNDYWVFYVNGKMPIVGIDSYMVNVEDLIEFDYIPYKSEVHKGTHAEKKFMTYTNMV